MKEKKYLQFFIYALVFMLAIWVQSVDSVYAEDIIVAESQTPSPASTPEPTPTPTPELTPTPTPELTPTPAPEPTPTPTPELTPTPTPELTPTPAPEPTPTPTPLEDRQVDDGFNEQGGAVSPHYVPRNYDDVYTENHTTENGQEYQPPTPTTPPTRTPTPTSTPPPTPTPSLRIEVTNYSHIENIQIYIGGQYHPIVDGVVQTDIPAPAGREHSVRVTGYNIDETIRRIQTTQGRAPLNLADIPILFSLRITNVPPSVHRVVLRDDNRNDEIRHNINVYGKGETGTFHYIREGNWWVTFYGDTEVLREGRLQLTPDTRHTLNLAELLHHQLEASSVVEEPSSEEQNNVPQVNDTTRPLETGGTWLDRVFPVFMLAAAVIIGLLLIMLLMGYRKSTPKRRQSAPSYDNRNAQAHDSIIRAMDIKTNRYNNDNVVSFSIHERDLIYVTGRSGAGKTVLLKMLAGYDKNTSGSLMFDIDGSKLTWQNDDKELKSLIGFVPQLDSLYGNLTPYQLLDYYCKCFYGKTSKIKIENSLYALGLFERKDNKIDSLSGGQRKRVSIAIELLRGARILILDEPDSGLDLESREDLYNMLEEVRIHNGVTIILSTHFQENIEYSGVESMPIYDSEVYNSSSKKEKIKMHKKSA